MEAHRALPPDDEGVSVRHFAVPVARSLVRIGALLTLLVPVGLIAAGVEYLVAGGLVATASAAQFPTVADTSLYTSGLLAGVSFLLLFGVPLLVPVLWRRLRLGPRHFRALALVGVQCYAIGAGLLIGRGGVPGWWITFLLSCVGTLGWFAWQRRWRGDGMAPSILTGVVRPPVAPGQVWYAYVVGNRETKVRPVLVLKDSGGKRWVVVYLTSKEPHANVAHNYLEVAEGNLRGLPRRSWAHLSDTRALAKGRFRTYVGRMPGGLYQQVCESVGVSPREDAQVLREGRAGRVKGPAEVAMRHAFGASPPGLGSGAQAWGTDQTASLFLRELWRSLRT